jgi:hypothetical protein
MESIWACGWGWVWAFAIVIVTPFTIAGVITVLLVDGLCINNEKLISDQRHPVTMCKQ